MEMKLVETWTIPMINLKATGKNITRLRKSAGISVRDLQTILGFTNPQAIYKWQNGICLPTIDNLVILASVLGVTVDEILIIEGDVSEAGTVQKDKNVSEAGTVHEDKNQINYVI